MLIINKQKAKNSLSWLNLPSKICSSIGAAERNNVFLADAECIIHKSPFVY